LLAQKIWVAGDLDQRGEAPILLLCGRATLIRIQQRIAAVIFFRQSRSGENGVEIADDRNFMRRFSRRCRMTNAKMS
jgi:hypothetical protein